MKKLLGERKEWIVSALMILIMIIFLISSKSKSEIFVSSATFVMLFFLTVIKFEYRNAKRILKGNTLTEGNINSPTRFFILTEDVYALVKEISKDEFYKIKGGQNDNQ